MPETPEETRINRLEQQLAELRGLVGVITLLNRSLEVDEILASAVQGIQRVLGGSYGCFILLNPESSRLELGQSVGLAPSLYARLERLVRECQPIVPPVLPTNTPVLHQVGELVRQILPPDSSEWVTLIPLTAQARPIGVLLLAIRAGRVPKPPSVDMLMSIGEHIGMAIENARLHAAVRDSEQWNRTFLEKMPDGCLEGEFNGRITYVNDAASRILGYTHDELLCMPFTVLIDNLREMAQMRKVLFRQGYFADQPTVLCIKGGERRTASVTARLVRNHARHTVLYQVIFRDITEQKRAFDMLERRHRELSALNSIGNILSHPLEMPQALKQVCEQITTLTGLESAAISLVDESRQNLRLAAHYGIADWLVAQVREVGLDDPKARAIAIEGQTIALNDLMIENSPGFAGPRAAGYRAGIAVPIKIRNKPVGMLLAGSKSRVQYEPSDVALLTNIAERIGMALENADLYVEMQRRLDELDGLAQLSAACATSLDPQAVSDLAVAWTLKLLDADVCSIRLIQGEKMRLGAVLGQAEGTKIEELLPMHPQTHVIVDRRTPLVVSDAARDATLEPPLKQTLDALNVRAVLAVALPARGRVIGVLTIGYRNPHDWLEREINLLQTIANETANAIHNAQLYQQVLSEKRKVQAIFDSGISGLFATDAHGVIVMFNRAAERMTGWTANEVVGKEWVQVFESGKNETETEPLINEALLRKKPTYVPEGNTIMTRYGTTIPIANAVAPLLDDADRVTGAVGAFWDLTRIQEAELDRANFLSEVAHQIRNPLTALISGLELLDDRRLTPKQRAELRELAKSQAERLRKISRQLLDHQKTTYSSQPVQCKNLPIVPYVQQLTDEFRLSFPNHVFQVLCSDPELKVHADSDRLDGILRNLLDNAVTYSKTGSLITLDIRLTQSGDSVNIAVHDQGMGIPVQEQEHIFEPFFRASHSTERRVYGHGLGLYIARQMAQQIDARIEFESHEQSGSIFYLILRRAA